MGIVAANGFEATNSLSELNKIKLVKKTLSKKSNIFLELDSSLRSSIIIINKKSTAIAPIYTIINNKPKKSLLYPTRTPAEAINRETSVKIEYIGFLFTTKKLPRVIITKRKKRLKVVNIYLTDKRFK